MPSAWICSGPLVNDVVVTFDAVLLPEPLVFGDRQQARAVEVGDVAEVDVDRFECLAGCPAGLFGGTAASGASAHGERHGDADGGGAEQLPGE